jgi:hypothetical protein
MLDTALALHNVSSKQYTKNQLSSSNLAAFQNKAQEYL